jgi:ketopantoate reductase
MKLSGAINPEKFGNHERGYSRPLRWILLKFAGVKYRNLKSNIQVDLERGNKTEVDYINGAIVREGERVGFDTPVNRMVVDMVKEIEAGHREMGVGNLFEIWSATREGD